jgi:hypothetical protein
MRTIGEARRLLHRQGPVREVLQVGKLPIPQPGSGCSLVKGICCVERLRDVLERARCSRWVRWPGLGR